MVFGHFQQIFWHQSDLSYFGSFPETGCCHLTIQNVAWGRLWNIIVTTKNIHLPNMIPFSWLVREMCRHLCRSMCFQKRKGCRTIMHIFVTSKNIHLPNLVPLVSSRDVQKFVFHLYGTPPFQKKEGCQNIMDIFSTTKIIYLPNLVPFSWLVLEMCRNLCLICMELLPSRRERTDLLHKKNLN